MHHDFLDRYSRGHSALHRISAGAKMLAAAGVIGLTVSLPKVPLLFAIAVTGLLVIVAVLARIRLGYLLQRVLWVEPLVLCAAAAMLWQPNGLERFLEIAIKTTLCLMTMVLLANTTPFADLLQVLRRCRVPSLLLSTLALLYRYGFVLADEAGRMHRARLARRFQPKRLRLWQNLGTVIGQLFVRATERAERIHAAMCARGWQVDQCGRGQ